MDVFGRVRECLTEILDIDAREISPDSYVIRDLNAESIDLLELSVALNSTFKVEIEDEDIFLRSLRFHLNEANENETVVDKYLAREFPFLTKERIEEILSDLEGGPVLKVKDLTSYLTWQLGRN